MRLAYLVMSLLPTLAVVTLAWFVVRRDLGPRRVARSRTARRLDDEPA